MRELLLAQTEDVSRMGMGSHDGVVATTWMHEATDNNFTPMMRY